MADWLDYLSRYNAIRNWLTSLHLLSFKKITSAHCANAFNMNRTLCCHYMWNLRHIGAVQILFKSILGFIGLIIESKLPCFMAHHVVLAQVIRCVYTCRANVLCIRRDTRTPGTLPWNPGENNATVAAGAIELQAHSRVRMERDCTVQSSGLDSGVGCGKVAVSPSTGLYHDNAGAVDAARCYDNCQSTSSPAATAALIDDSSSNNSSGGGGGGGVDETCYALVLLSPLL